MNVNKKSADESHDLKQADLKHRNFNLKGVAWLSLLIWPHDVTLKGTDMNAPPPSPLLFLLAHPQPPSDSPAGCCGGKPPLQTSQLWDNWKIANVVNTLWCLFTAAPHTHLHTHERVTAVSGFYWMAATSRMNMIYIFRLVWGFKSILKVGTCECV